MPGPELPVPSDHRGFDRGAPTQLDDTGDDAAVGKRDPLNRVPGVSEHLPVAQLHGLQMWMDVLGRLGTDACQERVAGLEHGCTSVPVIGRDTGRCPNVCYKAYMKFQAACPTMRWNLAVWFRGIWNDSV